MSSMGDSKFRVSSTGWWEDEIYQSGSTRLWCVTVDDKPVGFIGLVGSRSSEDAYMAALRVWGSQV